MMVCRIGYLSHCSSGSYWLRSCGGDGTDAVDIGFGGLAAVPGDVSSLAASVAGLTGRVQWAAVGSGAVTADVTQLSASVALDRCRLAITSKVVWSTTLVASGSPGTASESTAAAESTTRGTSSTTASDPWCVCAVPGKMARKTTRVATSARACAAQAQRRAVCLYVP